MQQFPTLPDMQQSPTAPDMQQFPTVHGMQQFTSTNCTIDNDDISMSGYSEKYK
ncbi:hypothetical protein DPMN_050899 [Dreissena polymorpha]|uniref:Uncharacterized protein n=1 Tax=Dreissena polymorpha TaxID=45954 RepID=A0A9D4CGZ2_DREPO|nr:hypothetical protein DPMN_050899 [Dreissena polymorpha]